MYSRSHSNEKSSNPIPLPYVRPGAAGLLTGVEHSRVGSSTWLCPTSFVSTRIGVELVDVQGNYPTHSE